MKFLFLIFSFFFFLYAAESLVLNCRCFTFEIGYRCRSKDLVITSKDDRTITEVKAIHEEGKTNDDVRDFASFDETVNFFPLGLGKFFKNLKSIKISRGHLKAISKEDLKQFNDLKKISLEANEIETINANLFEDHKNLVVILLSENKIKSFGNGTFRGLDKLTNLSLEDNACTTDSDRAIGDKAAIQYLISEIEKKCK